MAQDNNKKGHSFNASSAKRIAKVVQKVERWGTGGPIPPQVPVISGGGGRLAKTGVSTGITGGDLDNPGVGTVTWLEFKGANYIDTGITFQVYNSAGAVGTSKIIQCKKLNGYWFVDVAQCDGDE